MNPHLAQYVIDSFSSPPSLKKYTDDVQMGLWESESILINRYFTVGSKVLDLGCGVGRTTFPLLELGFYVSGVDITPKFIEIAKNIALSKNIDPAVFSVGDATELSFTSNSFDNALFSYNGWTMIPTKEARLAAVKEVYRVLKRGSYYIITAHVRHFVGQELIWITQWVRLNILKPLGYKTVETDMGDFYFKKDSETTYPIKQFINIPTVKEVLDVHLDNGFKLETMQMRSILSEKDRGLKSGDVMFFVFRK